MHAVHDSPARVPRQIDRWGPWLRRLLQPFDGALTLRLPDGSAARFGARATEPVAADFGLAVRDPRALRSLLLGRDPLRFADAYFRGRIDIEGDLFAALVLKDQVQALRLSVGERLRALGGLLCSRPARPTQAGAPSMPPASWSQARSVHTHTRAETRKAIAFHYDLSNSFYRLWLDPGMVYSCAYFEHPDMTLAQAQSAKLDHICRKLRLQPGEQFLDIGCGWGALLLHAAQHYGVHAHGITLSQRQLEVAQQRIAQAGLQRQVTVELRDYRDLRGQCRFDKIASVGMFEHVGLKNLPTYFACVHRLLKPHGQFLNHGITHDEEGWGRGVSTRFINCYVFPDGELDTVSNIQRAMEGCHFEILDVEGLRPHYARTLRHWVQRLEAHHAEALAHVSESTYRVWRLYMAASALEFEAGTLGVYQILSSRRAAGTQAFPSSRRYMYPPQARPGAAMALP